MRTNRAFIVIMKRPHSRPALVASGLSIFIAILIYSGCATSAHAYVLEGKSWPSGSVVTFQMGLGSAGRTLIDGNTSWDTAAAPAINAWDSVVARLQFNANLGAGSAAASGDGVNSVVFSGTIFGQTFGSGTLAVTYWRSSGSDMVEADILFNNHQAFDSYRGPLHFGSNGFAIGDIRRVFTHELGHALGLDHPDQHGQNVDAIMNSVTSDRETLSNDDISGAQFMYSASSAPTPTPTPTPIPIGNPTASHLANISTRTNVGTGDNVMIAGFIVSGSQSKTVLIRVLGPTLGSLGVANVLADPMLELHDSSGAVIAANDDWQIGSQVAQINATAYAPKNPDESALIATLAPGSYTAIVRGYNETTGVGLVEVYELDSVTTRLSNISTRGFVGTGDNVLIGGLIINGTLPKNVILRAIGPSMAAPPTSLGGTLSDPMLELHDGSGNLVASNDDWGSSPDALAIAATPYKPSNAKESAIISTLTPGSYTAIVRGVNNTTGIGLVEAYDLDP
jgi:hypothetical protein